MTTDLALDPRELSRCALDLHEHAHGVGYREQQAMIMERLQRVVPFDAGLLGGGTVENGVPSGHDVWLFQRPEAFMESWEQVKQEDRVAVEAMRVSGTTVNVDTEGPFFDGCDLVRSHCRTWKIAHTLCTALRTESLYWVMSVYREERERPFSEAERLFVELLVPHVFASARQARLGQLRRLARVSEAHGHSAAIASSEGLVVEAEPGFTELLRVEWPGWIGPQLPSELWQHMGSTPQARVRHGRLVVRADETEGVHLVHVRRSVLADELTAREREIAEAFSLGETHRDIGSRLAIAPSTVRRHLANIYEKLGISSKVELERMLSASFPVD